MNAESIKSFVTYYLQGLSERTRREKSGAKWGIDWIAYNLGLAKFGKPMRLPFIRSGPEGYPRGKSEAEFGIDLAFVSNDARELTIFVLKDEPLTNATWTRNDFDRDLRMAMAPDISPRDLAEVISVTIILAYNKDDHQNGIELFDRFVAAAPTKIGDHVSLNFLRWNLSDLVELTIQHILSPSLLPERFFGQLSYVSSQAADFPHGSEAWQTQLVPNWKRLVEDLLDDRLSPRGPAVVPVALIIVHEQAASNPSFETGWIELIEWSAIALWRLYANGSGGARAAGVLRFWSEFYVAELDRFYRAHIGELATEHSIDSLALGSYVGVVASAYVAYWHIARLGLLSLEHERSAERPEKTATPVEDRLNEVANWTTLLINANVAVFRPVLDIQHLEWFLLAATYRNAGRLPEFASLVEDLVARLYARRLGQSSLPFVDGANSLANVFEQIALKTDPSVVLSQSSFFVLMLLELCCILPDEQRNKLIPLIHRRLVLGVFDRGDPGSERPLDLMSWIPPNDWSKQVLGDQMSEGQGVVVGAFANQREATADKILAGIRRLVIAMKDAHPPSPQDADIPLAASILASLLHHTPLPPDLWRRWAFPDVICSTGDSAP